MHTRNPNFDYTRPACYFITTAPSPRLPFFAQIKHGTTGLTSHGCIVAECWQEIPTHYPGWGLDSFIVMPDHFHGIIFRRKGHPPYSESLSQIIRDFKGAASRRIRKRTPWFGWSKGFHDEIVRNKAQLQVYRDYIWENPWNAGPTQRPPSPKW